MSDMLDVVNALWRPGGRQGDARQVHVAVFEADRDARQQSEGGGRHRIGVAAGVAS